MWVAAREEWGVNWRIGLAAFLAIGFSFGAYQTVSSLFVIPLQQAFGWSRSEIAFAQNGAIILALISPFFGRLVDHFGPRRIMLIGMPLSAVMYCLLASMNGSLALYYALQLGAMVIGNSASGLTCSRVISSSFVRSRGLSLAVTRSGLALAGAALPMLLFWVIARFGWRGGYVLEAALVLFVAFPAVYLWIGRNPSQATTAQRATDLPSWFQLLHDRRVWLICLGAGFGYAPAMAIMGQLQPLLVSKGIEPGAGAGLVGLAGIASFVGALVTGSLVDRFWAPAIAFLFACGSALGACILAWHGTLDGPAASAAILLVGVGLGAEIDVVAYMVSRYFGVRSFSTLYGLAVLFISSFSAAGAALLGIVYDRAGSYDSALYLVAGSFLSAGCLYLLLGPYPAEHKH